MNIPEILSRPRPFTLEFASHDEAIQWRWTAYNWLRNHPDKKARFIVHDNKVTVRELFRQPEPVAVRAYVPPVDLDRSKFPPFDLHHCWRCQSGRKPCVRGNAFQCENLHARND